MSQTNFEKWKQGLTTVEADVPRRANAWTREELRIVERILSLRAEIRELKRRLSSRRTSGAIRVRFAIVSNSSAISRKHKEEQHA